MVLGHEATLSPKAARCRLLFGVFSVFFPKA